MKKIIKLLLYRYKHLYYYNSRGDIVRELTEAEKVEFCERLLDGVAKYYTELFKDDPDPLQQRFVIYEWTHPKKKPRGSIRRNRRLKNES